MPLSPNSPLGRLLAGPIRPGRLVWVGLRPARKSPIEIRSEAWLQPGRGLDGDHYDSQRAGPRQVTLIAAEDLEAIGSFLGGQAVDPEEVRRNLVTRGVNLLALKDRRFHIGETLLEGSGECPPCGRMERNLGAGGYNAMRGHGGITARVLVGGRIRVGDPVVKAELDAPPG